MSGTRVWEVEIDEIMSEGVIGFRRFMKTWESGKLELEDCFAQYLEDDDSEIGDVKGL